MNQNTLYNSTHHQKLKTIFGVASWEASFLWPKREVAKKNTNKKIKANNMQIEKYKNKTQMYKLRSWRQQRRRRLSQRYCRHIII